MLATGAAAGHAATAREQQHTAQRKQHAGAHASSQVISSRRYNTFYPLCIRHHLINPYRIFINRIRCTD